MTDNRVKLKGRRELLGLSQAAAAAKASVSESEWSDYESGARPLPDATLAELSTGIGFHPRDAAQRYWEQIVQLCAAYQASAPRLLGPLGLGGENDLDLVVTSEPNMSAFDLFELEEKLEELCSVSFRVITEDGLAQVGPTWQKVANSESATVADRDQALLEDMLDLGRQAQDLAFEGRDAFNSDLLIRGHAQMICVRMGSSAKRLSPELVASQPQIQFEFMATLGDEVASDYMEGELEKVWSAIADEFPTEIAKIQALLASHWKRD